MTTAASEQIKLTDNYELDVSISSDWQEITSYTFMVVRVDDEQRNRAKTPTIDIELPLQRLKPYKGWRVSNSGWTPEYEVQYGSLKVNYFGTNDPEQGLASSIALMLASDCLSALHRAAAPQLSKQSAERAAKLEAEIKAEEAKEAERNKLKEELQWYVGHKFKLRRDGYKATVFGTIDNFTDTHVYTTSERGVKMDTRISDINFFAVMYDGERRYTKVFERSAK